MARKRVVEPSGVKTWEDANDALRQIAEAQLALADIEGEMNKQICDDKYRIIFIFSDGYLHSFSVLFDDDAVQCERLCHPLIFFYTAIIMSIKISKFFIFIERILFHVNTRRINMCSKNIHSLRNRSLTDSK